MKHNQQDIDNAVAAILSKNLVAGIVRVPSVNDAPPQRALSHEEQNAEWARVYAREFPHVITSGVDALSDGEARAWLEREVGAIARDWRVLPGYPTFQQDTYFFKTAEQALWFKLSFS